MNVSVVLAWPNEQTSVVLQVNPGVRAREAVVRAYASQSDIDTHSCPIGVFGKKVNDDYLLKDGDRLELYRPITCDPKAVRRERAALRQATKKQTHE